MTKGLRLEPTSSMYDITSLLPASSAHPEEHKKLFYQNTSRIEPVFPKTIKIEPILVKIDKHCSCSVYFIKVIQYFGVDYPTLAAAAPYWIHRLFDTSGNRLWLYSPRSNNAWLFPAPSPENRRRSIKDQWVDRE